MDQEHIDRREHAEQRIRNHVRDDFCLSGKALLLASISRPAFIVGAAYDDAMRGAIVGAPAIEGGY